MRRYWDIFATFFSIGLFTLGGGYAMLPLIERAVVTRRRWLDGPLFVDMLALAQALPGPVALNTAVFTGHRVRGVGGALAAAAGVVLPAFGAMLAIVLFLAPYRDHPTVSAAFAGLRPAVAALIVATLPRLAKKAGLRWPGLLVAAAVAGLLAQRLWPVSPAWIVAAAVAWAWLRPLPPPPPTASAPGDRTAAAPCPASGGAGSFLEKTPSGDEARQAGQWGEDAPGSPVEAPAAAPSFAVPRREG